MVSEGDLGKPTKVAKDAQFPSKPRFDKVTGLAEPANKQDMAMDLPLRCYRCGKVMKQSKLLTHLEKPEPDEDKEAK